jgi:D-alanyl-D-alanine carboxypeptidase
MMPLASTVKIIIAIEYAEQAAQGQINPDEKISLSELNCHII